MAVLNIFKKNKPSEKKVKVQETKEVKAVKPVEAPKPKKEIKFRGAYRVLRSPHITEKAADLAKENKYVFKIWPGVNKAEIKKAVAQLYGVDVLDVKTIKIPSKRRRLGRISGKTPEGRKAIIKIKEGQKIEIMPR